ncbi:MAG: alpha/beta hydrolase, partial [Alphaproteobacteria bacterium]|nr:alpha/beta hydrolase [Alphaproteobacteria bacterium]
ALLFFHGGGWVIGSHETVEPQCRYLAHAARAVVISVEYRCAPEYPFPAAVDDCLWATRWTRDNAATLGVDPRRIAVGGDSAGGGLAAVVAQQMREAGDPPLAHQLLLFPATSMVFDAPSYTENADGPFLTRPMMEWFRALYIPDPAHWRDSRASPALAATLGGLPPATIVTASHDPLRDEGIAYGERLAAAGVAVHHRNFEGYTHAFLSWGGYIDAAFEALDFAAEGLRESFAATG